MNTEVREASCCAEGHTTRRTPGCSASRLASLRRTAGASRGRSSHGRGRFGFSLEERPPCCSVTSNSVTGKTFLRSGACVALHTLQGEPGHGPMTLSQGHCHCTRRTPTTCQGAKLCRKGPSEARQCTDREGLHHLRFGRRLGPAVAPAEGSPKTPVCLRSFSLEP